MSEGMRTARRPAGAPSGRVARRAAAALVAALVMAPAVLAGQEGVDGGAEGVSADVEAELVRRIDELLPRYRAIADRASEAREARAAARRLAELPVETVTLDVGGITVVTLPGQEDDARRLISSELVRLGPLARFDALDDRAIVFQFGHTLERISHGAPATAVEVRRFFGEDIVRRRIRTVFGDRIRDAMPALVAFWMGGFATVPDPRPTDVHRMMVLEGSRAGQACMRGDLDACWASFGLSGSADPIVEWYGPEQIRVLSRRSLHRWSECRSSAAADAEACDREFLVTSRAWTGAIPYGRIARMDLVAFALQQGGDGALERFLADWPAGAEEAGAGSGSRAAPAGMPLDAFGHEMQRHLAAAADLPADELMARWRERVLAAGPAGREDGNSSRTAAMAWFLFFAALATRSTRWRLG